MKPLFRLSRVINTHYYIKLRLMGLKPTISVTTLKLTN